MYGPHRHGGTLAVADAWKYMSSNARDNPDDLEADREQDRYAELNVGDEEFVIYDRESPNAWIQSSVAVTVSDHR